MKILIMSDHFPPDSPGGAGQTALSQCRILQAMGHEVQVLGVRQHDSDPVDLLIDGIPVHRLKISYPQRWRAYFSLYNPSAARQVKAYLRANPPDIIHAHNVHAYLSYHSLKIAKSLGFPVVLTTHDVMSAAYQKFDSFIDPTWQDIPESFDYRVRAMSQFKKQRFRYFPPRNAIIRRIIRHNVDVIASPSQTMIDFLKANQIAPIRRSVVIHNGIDLDRFTSSEAEQATFRANQGLEGKKLILFAGRVNGAKGGKQILEALPQIVARIPDATLLVLSRPGGYGDWMLSEAERLGVKDNIHFAGWLEKDQLAAAYGASDVCVIPSICFDNFPTVALEAGAASLPVVATCFGGAREIVVDRQSGYIINPYNIKTLADRLADILSDSALQQQMGIAAQARVIENFGIVRQGERLLELYESLG